MPSARWMTWSCSLAQANADLAADEVVEHELRLRAASTAARRLAGPSASNRCASASVSARQRRL